MFKVARYPVLCGRILHIVSPASIRHCRPQCILFIIIVQFCRSIRSVQFSPQHKTKTDQKTEYLRDHNTSKRPVCDIIGVCIFQIGRQALCRSQQYCNAEQGPGQTTCAFNAAGVSGPDRRRTARRTKWWGLTSG